MKKTICSIIFLFAIIVNLIGCASFRQVANSSIRYCVASTSQEILETPVTEDTYATILSFGDTLTHSQVYDSAYDDETQTYCFSPIFEFVKKYIQNATISIGNLECPMAGPDRDYSGYPCFNTPEALATDLAELGVDVVSTGTNHSLDKGFSGLCSTLNFLDEAGISHVGTARSKEEQDSICFVDLNGIKGAILCGTYGTNGIPVPSGKEFCVNLLNKNLISSHIAKAKAEGSEIIVFCMHNGIEYQTTENSDQISWAEWLISNGVDIVLGCHPHVLQPMRMITVRDKEGNEKTGLVIFSMGNFYSAQTKLNTRNTALFEIEIKKNGSTGVVSIEKAKYIPLYLYDYKKDTGITRNRYKLLDLEDIIQSYESGENTWSKNFYNLALEESQRCYNIIGPEIDNTISE